MAVPSSKLNKPTKALKCFLNTSACDKWSVKSNSLEKAGQRFLELNT